MDTKLQGRVALVTGGSRGIGRAIALALAREGAAVAVGYRSGNAEAEGVVAEVRQMNGTALAVQGDVADYEQVTTMVSRTIDGLGGLHILVNNAGIAKDTLVYRMEPDDWLEVMQANFGGVLHCTKAVLDHFMRQRDGVIVNVSSIQANHGSLGTSLYAASKGAINSFTRSSAVELARFGVRVNAVLPGFVPTDLVAGLPGERWQAIARQVPLRRLPAVDEVARVAVFLAGPDAAYMTGCLVPVDGGAGIVLSVGR
jgi:3-oxoacyl-[acyl-carrier protein] reductase